MRIIHQLPYREIMAKRDLIQGTLDMLVLKTLAPGPMHGYAIAVAIDTAQQKSFAWRKVHSILLYTGWKLRNF